MRYPDMTWRRHVWILGDRARAFIEKILHILRERFPDYDEVAMRWWAIATKELLQVTRDRLTLSMILGVPVIQLMLFGFAINTDPKNLPTALVSLDEGPLARSAVTGIRQSGYFDLLGQLWTPETAERRLEEGEIQFVITIPEDFSRRVIRGERPALMVEADATDPSATANALGALQRATAEGLGHDFVGPLAYLAAAPPAFELVIHKNFNPEGITRYNIVPGLMGVILTMTMVLMTSLAITRERERGTLENLLATPAYPSEVITGKMAPYVAIGFAQVSLILISAKWLFGVPMLGSYFELLAAVLLFILSNLFLGISFSVIASNQLQAMQLTFFYFLPSILLSGFMFPFRGMPEWAQIVGNILPLTHVLHIVRGVMLKGISLYRLWPDILAIAIFASVTGAFAVSRYRQTLD